MAERSCAEWSALLDRVNVPCGPIYEMDQVFADPQVRHRGMMCEVALPDGQPLALPANPIRYDGAQTTSAKAPPALGADTVALLTGELGLTDAQIDGLRKAGII